MRPTIKDVAKKAGVSTATVSLVIHGHERITPVTRRKVQRAIELLDYHPSSTARGLASRKTGNIGFILTDDHFLRTEPFYTKIFLGAEFEARNFPYYILLSTIPTEFGSGHVLPRFILENNVDGLIIAGKVPSNFMKKLDAYALPIVFVDYYPLKGDYSAVLIDNLNGGSQATEHLIHNGCRDIAFIAGDMEHPSIRDRLAGYKMALDKHGIVFDDRRVITTEKATTRESGFHAMKELIQRGISISAVFACNDAMAMGAIQYLKQEGISIPGDICIIGFDDIEGDLDNDPPLSSMAVPKLDMGAEAITLMLAKLQGKVKGSKKILVPVDLVSRKSTTNK